MADPSWTKSGFESGLITGQRRRFREPARAVVAAPKPETQKPSTANRNKTVSFRHVGRCWRAVAPENLSTPSRRLLDIVAEVPVALARARVGLINRIRVSNPNSCQSALSSLESTAPPFPVSAAPHAILFRA
jgi:hypothetical protein